MIWVGKNLADQAVIGCIYKARDVGMVRSAIVLACAAANEGCYPLIDGDSDLSRPQGRGL